MSPFTTGQYSELIDKPVLFLCSLALSHGLFPQAPQVLPFLLALIFIALLGYLDPGPKRRMLLGIYALVCIPLPPLTLYLPALAHEVLYSEPPWILFIPALPLGLFPFLSGWPPFLTLLPVLALGLLLKSKARHSDRQKEQVHRFQDHLQQTRQDLARLQQTQEEQQENSAWLATLKERNRIARDIHDNVGHLLTSSLLQTAALLSGPLTDEQTHQLSSLKETLGEGLDRIRSSVHQLHESPADLETEIGRLLKGLTTCTCRQTIELLGVPHRDHRHCLLAVVREALSNVIRHSDATELSLTLKEHPAFYQLAIADNGQVRPAQNGRVSPVKEAEGLGLRSMEERVSLLGGRLHISRDRGFSLFITLPKG